MFKLLKQKMIGRRQRCGDRSPVFAEKASPLEHGKRLLGRTILHTDAQDAKFQDLTGFKNLGGLLEREFVDRVGVATRERNKQIGGGSIELAGEREQVRVHG